MGLKTNKPRGRNGGRPRKLNDDQRRALGRHAYLLKRGAPIPSYELPSDRAEDEDDVEQEWLWSDAALAIANAKQDMREGGDGDAISNAIAKASRNKLISSEAVSTAVKVIAANVDGLEPSDWIERHLRRDRRKRPKANTIGLAPPNPHWCAASVEWAAKHLRVEVGGDLVREVEREYRQVREQWDRMANEDSN